jgi:hypothetical protein
LNEIKTTDKGDIKDLINNPKQPHVKAAITYHALEKLRRGMRKQLKTLGGAEEDTDFFDAQESVDLKDIPQTLIAQMGQELGVEDMDLSNFDETFEDKEMAVVENNLGNDFLSGSEALLMNGFSLLGESENEPELPPPLPVETIKPPEPVPPPSSTSSEAVFSSVNKPWSAAPPPPPPKPIAARFYNEEDWDIDSAKNPDPPSLHNARNISIVTTNRQKSETRSITVITSNRSRSETPVIEITPSVVNDVKPEPVVASCNTPLRDEISTPQNKTDDWGADVCPTPFSSNGQQTPVEVPKEPTEQGKLILKFNKIYN